MTVLESAATIDKFVTALYTQAEASRFLGLSTSTFRNWARGYRSTIQGREVVGKPVLSTVGRAGHHGPNIPFIGLAEGYALGAMRRAGVPLQRIRPALHQLDKEMGVPHALASKTLFTDGAEILYDYAKTVGGAEEHAVRDLVVVRNGQRVLTRVVANYLQRIEFGVDGFASVVPLPDFEGASVVADFGRSFGQPIFQRGGAKLEDVVDLFKAERDLAVVSEEFGVPPSELQIALAALIKAA